MKERLALFSEYGNVKDLELLLLYSGGHWRTLDVINSKLRANWNIGELNVIIYDPLLKNSDKLSPEIWSKIIRLSLLGQEVPATYQLESSVQNPITLENAISRAPLLNSLTDLEPSFVPRLSIIQLMTWLRDVSGDPNNTLYLPVKNVLDEYDQLRSSQTHGHRFERFHAYWEVLQNRLDPNGPLSLVRNVWKHMNQIFDLNFGKPKISQQQMEHLQKVVAKLNNFLKQSFEPISKTLNDLGKIITQTQLTKFQQRKLENNYDVINQLIDQDEEFQKSIPADAKNKQEQRMKLWNESIRFKYVFLLPASYPDIDIISFFKSTNGEVFVLIEQLKTQYKVAGFLDKKEICTRTMALKSFEMLFPNQGIPENNVLFAVVAWKDVKPADAVKLITPNIEKMKRRNPLDDFPNRFHLDLVAAIPELRKCYGPTLESVGWLLGTESTKPVVAGSFTTSV